MIVLFQHFVLFLITRMTVPLADDQQALIWDIQQMPRPIDDPILAYRADGEINQVRAEGLVIKKREISESWALHCERYLKKINFELVL